jgi:hypothetical protein
MKKIIISFCIAAIVAMAAVNVNIALNSEKTSGLSLAGLLSLAQQENPWGVGTESEEHKDFPNMREEPQNYTILCNGQTITPMACGSSGDGCTRISCLVVFD